MVSDTGDAMVLIEMIKWIIKHDWELRLDAFRWNEDSFLVINSLQWSISIYDRQSIMHTHFSYVCSATNIRITSNESWPFEEKSTWTFFNSCPDFILSQIQQWEMRRLRKTFQCTFHILILDIHFKLRINYWSKSIHCNPITRFLLRHA